MKKSGFRKCLALILVFALCAPALSVNAGASEAPLYNDVSGDIWYFPYVSFVTEKGYMLGYGNGSFGPNDMITRAQMVTVLYALANKPEAASGGTFPDVAGTDWFAAPALWAGGTGIAEADEGGYFRPHDPISRQDAVVMLSVFAKMNGIDTTPLEDAALDAFPDAGELGDHAVSAMTWAVGAGIICGSGGFLRPLDSLTRAEAATIIRSFVENVSKPAPEPTPGPTPEPEPEPEVPREPATGRQALEDAVVETAWAYYFKEQVQYDSQLLTAVWDKEVAAYRVTQEQPPEYATPDTNLFSVCTYYVYESYFNALGYRVGERDISHVRTNNLWDETADDDKSLILRWSSDKAKPNINNDYDDVNDLIEGLETTWETLLRPGDWIVVHSGTGGGHAVMYIGNGMLLECYGAKYSDETGRDVVEPLGAIRLNGFWNYYLNPNSSYYLGKGTAKFYILRPINLLVDEEDNIIAEKATVSTSALTREKYPGIEINRTVDISPYGTAEAGRELTYSIAITNNSNSTYTKGIDAQAGGVDVNYMNWRREYYGLDSYAGTKYTSLPVTAPIPEGTELVSATPGFSVENGAAVWKVNVPAGETVTLTYTVKVTADVGETVSSTGGSVDGIPLNTIENRVGGSKLNTANVDNYLKYAPQYHVNETNLANGIYSGVFGLELGLPDVQEIVRSLFEPKKVGSVDMLVLRSASGAGARAGAVDVSRMLVNKYFGGQRVHSDQAKNERIWEYSERYFEVGDILIKGTLNASNYADMTVSSSKTLVYMGDGYFACVDGGLPAASNSQQLYADVFKGSYDFFFLLRPRQAYEAIGDELDGAVPFEPDKTLISDSADDTPAEAGDLAAWQSAIAETARAYARRSAYAVYSDTVLTKLGKSGSIAATWNIAPEEIGETQKYYGTAGYLIYEVYREALGLSLAENQAGMDELHTLIDTYKAEGEQQPGDIVVVDGTGLALYLGNNEYFTMTGGGAITTGALPGNVTAVLRPLKALEGEAHLTANGAGRNAFPGLDVTASSSAGSKYVTVEGGDQVTYTVTVANRGTETYSNLEILLFAPRNGTYDNAHTETDGAAYGGYTAANRLLTWTVASLEAGGSVTVTYTVTAGEVGEDAVLYRLSAKGKVGTGGKYVKLPDVTNRIGFVSLDEAQRQKLLDITSENITGITANSGAAGYRELISWLGLYDEANFGGIDSFPSFTKICNYTDGRSGSVLVMDADEDSESFGMAECIALDDPSTRFGVYLVEDFLGGELVVGSPAADRRILEPSLDLLDAGDIIMGLYGTKLDKQNASGKSWYYAGFDGERYHVIDFNSKPAQVKTYDDPTAFFEELNLLHAYDESDAGQARYLAFVVVRASQVGRISDPNGPAVTTGLELDVTSDKGDFRNVRTGDEITYTVTLKNTDLTTRAVKLTATVEGGTVTGSAEWSGSLSFNETKTLTFTVKVTAELTGSVLVSVKAQVEEENLEIAEGTQNPVAYELSAEQKEALFQYDSDSYGAIANTIRDPYKNALKVDTDANFLPSQSSYINPGSSTVAFKLDEESGKYKKDASPDATRADWLNLIVAYGGKSVLPAEDDPEYILAEELSFDFLEPGDYITVKTASNSTPFYLYLGKDGNTGRYVFFTSSKGRTEYSRSQASALIASTAQWFFVLRPGNQYKLNDGETVPEPEPGPEPEPEATFERGASLVSPRSTAVIGSEITFTVTVSNPGKEDLTVTETVTGGKIKTAQDGTVGEGGTTATWTVKAGTESSTLTYTVIVDAPASEDGKPHGVKLTRVSTVGDDTVTVSYRVGYALSAEQTAALAALPDTTKTDNIGTVRTLFGQVMNTPPPVAHRDRSNCAS